MRIESLNAKNGDPILKIDDYYLHSKYNPKREAEQFVTSKYKPDTVQILYGVGKEYILNELIKVRKNKEKILVVEPILSINIKAENVFVCTFESKDDLSRFLNQHIRMIDTLNILTAPNYDKISMEKYKDFLEVVNRKLQHSSVDESTMKMFTDKWQENYISNLKCASLDQSIVNLKSYYNTPVVVASGGPSLTKQIPLLKKYREKFVLIASGSTINSLIHNGIEPDYVVSIDGGNANFEHFKNLELQNSQFMYSVQSHPEIRNSFTRQGYYFLPMNAAVSINHLAKIVDEDPVVVPGGGSVANYAFSIATFISSGPIALVGQDLAYTDNKTHAENNKHAKLLDETFKSSNNLFYTEGYNGDSVLTSYSFDTMKNSFEQLALSIVGKREIFNSTEGGVLIKNFENISFEVFCKKYAKENVLIQLTPKISMEKEKLEKLLIKVKAEIKIYSRLGILLKKNMELLKKNTLKTYFEKSIITKIEKNDKEIRKLVQKTCIDTSIKQVNYEVLKYFKEQKNESAEDAYNRIYKQSHYLYNNMLEAVNRTSFYMEKQLIENLNGELEKING
ncbi:motility associated factor glycosyltransferase family protein [Lysinibacillus sp. NPDC056959]|uniref:motility associated factor glycosyltransferase family protein n=1 Tax=Lysinibacillus sp. NPDC056959 TaxID=3345981 RepID=UPI00363EA05D